jgi:3-oxoacyl-[acyl-carrier-protein] synthase II
VGAKWNFVNDGKRENSELRTRFQEFGTQNSQLGIHNLEAATRNPRTGTQKQIWITDVATVTALGNNLQELWQRLLAGQTAIKPVTRFPVHNYNAHIAACIEDLKPLGGRSIVQILLDQLCNGMGSVPSDSLLITATTKAGIDSFERLRRGIGADSQDVLPSRIPDMISQKFGLACKAINISAACASSTIAIGCGAGLIASGRAETVLVCCVDLVTEFIFSGFSCLQALSPVPCQPFDRDRRGLTLGEGASALLLMSAERARQENRSFLGTILGWGVANDAAHITAPARDGCGLIQAIHQAFKKAGLQAEEIAAISAHGTGTVHNDLMELIAFREVFGRREVPIHSVKGAIGHTMGAAGGIEVALGLKTLAAKVVPPTVGYCNPEKGAEGVVSPEPEDMVGDYLLTTNSGFGGVNAAIILGRGSID